MKNTQGRRIIARLKRKPMTYLEMNMLGISVSPQKRVMESLRGGERVIKGVDKRGRTTWRVKDFGRF
jgi:hypothetical protein